LASVTQQMCRLCLISHSYKLGPINL
jgi:hypothetical protein